MSLEAALIEHSQVMRDLLARLTATALTSEAPPKPAAASAPASPPVEAVTPALDALAQKAEATAQELTGGGRVAGTPAPTYEDVKRAILEVSKAKGRDAALKVLAQFGAAKGPDLQSKPETFGPFIAAATAVIGG